MSKKKALEKTLQKYKIRQIEYKKLNLYEKENFSNADNLWV